MSLDALIDRYCEAWSHDDPAQRRQALRDCWADGAVYCDPTAHVVGAEALAAHIDAFHQRIPAMSIARTNTIHALRYE